VDFVPVELAFAVAAAVVAAVSGAPVDAVGTVGVEARFGVRVGEAGSEGGGGFFLFARPDRLL
jgi:hypothetical protein